MNTLRTAAEQALKRAEAMLREPTETMSNAKVLAEVMRQCWLLHGELSAALAAEQPQPEVQPVRGWQPIATAPRDSKRPLYLAKFDGKGEMRAIDFDGGWGFWRESWEMPNINGWDWTSASGIEDPTHWAYQDEGAPPATPLPEAQPVAAAPEPSRTLTQDERDVFDAAERRSTKVVVPEPSEAQVDAAMRAFRLDRNPWESMRAALRAAAAARNTNPA